MSANGPVSAPPFAPLGATPLGLDRARLLEAMEPFVARRTTPDDPDFAAEVERKTRKTRARLRKRRWLGWLRATRRGQREIESIYDESWSRKRFAPYAMEPRPARGAAWEYADQALFATMAAGARARLLVLLRTIAWLSPRSVLEVGAGNGVNLLVAACRFPGIRFAGVELTPGGVAVARSAQQEAALPEVLQRFAPEPPIDVAAHRRVDFRQGSADRLPFEDGAFDLVYSSLALEQMEEVRERALHEMARVAGRHVAMLEPFVESNDAGLRRDYRLSREHFAGAVADLPRYGLAPILVTDDLPGEVWLRPCLVVCRRGPPEGAGRP